MNGRSLVLRWLIFAGSFAALYGGYTAWRVHRHQELSDQAAAAQRERAESLNGGASASKGKPAVPPDFTLIDQDGQSFGSKDLRGQVWVGSYFFTNCPAVCWRLNQSLAAWQETHPNSPIRFVSISCDPENDTPEVLVRYAKRFNADPKRWTFLTGDMATIVRLGTETFQVSVEKGTHSDRAFVVDREGKVRGRFRVTEPDQFEKLKLLLTQLDAEVPAETVGAAPATSEAGSAGAVVRGDEPQPDVVAAPAATPPLEAARGAAE